MKHYLIIQNQAELTTIKPKVQLIEIGRNIYEVGYHYKKFHGKKPKGEDVIWY